MKNRLTQTIAQATRTKSKLFCAYITLGYPSLAQTERIIPVAITTPYFQVTSPVEVGKLLMRLWPGTTLREIEIRDQAMSFNEFVHGQLELST